MTPSLLALLLMQAGPLVSSGAAPPIQPVPLPRIGTTTPPSAAPTAPEPTRLELCLQATDKDPLAAIEAAEEWLKIAKGTATVDPNHCLGVAHSRLGRPVEAELAYTFARDAVAASEPARKAAFGAMAALAMLEQDDAARADAAFADALALARTGGDARLAGDIAIDRARAQVALKQDDAAAASLAEGRSASPQNAAGWLLSATLSRRGGRLAEAQGFIEQAADLAPFDAAIGLEAGVIAVLSGRESAARKSWESVIKVAPGSAAANLATGYLDQLGPAAPTSITAPMEGR